MTSAGYGASNPLRSSVARLDQALVIMEDTMVWSNVGHVRKARPRVLDLRDIQAPKTTLIDLPVGGRFYSGIVASGDQLLLGYYEAGLLTDWSTSLPAARVASRHSEAMYWQAEGEARVTKAPFFIRPFIRSRAEKEATRRGLTQVTTALLDELKASEQKPRPEEQIAQAMTTPT